MITIVQTLICDFIIYRTDAATDTASIYLYISIYSLVFWVHAFFSPPWSQHLCLSFTVSLPHPSLSYSPSLCFFFFFFYGSLCISLSVSDSQWVEKASLQIRAGRSTRSLEYRTARAQRHSDTYWISQHTRLWLNNCVWEKKETNGERERRGRRCMVLILGFFYEFLLFSFSSPSFLFHPSTNLSFRSDVISLLSSAGTGQSVACRWASCLCARKLVCMCIMTLIYIIQLWRKKKKMVRRLWSRWQQENVSDFEPQKHNTERITGR